MAKTGEAERLIRLYEDHLDSLRVGGFLTEQTEKELSDALRVELERLAQEDA